MQTSAQSIQSELRRLKTAHPTLRMRDIAQTLGISEAALVASACGTGGATVRLDRQFPAQFASLGTLGRVMALTRNICAVIEKIGIYGPLEHSEHASQVIGSDIDLRIFFRRFHHAFAVTSEGPRGPHKSLQFFDAHGDAVHKVHLLPESDLTAFAQLVDRFTAADQSPGLDDDSSELDRDRRDETERLAASPAMPADPAQAADAMALRAAFSRMQDTHEFFGLLRHFRLRRIHALQLLGPEAARPVDRLSLRGLLHAAADCALPLMLFVGNPAVIQIHSGPIYTPRQLGPWLNVLDPGFNLHVHEPGLATAWVVRKPTREGIVSSLELYDAAGESVLYAFSKRKPGQVESDDWRSLLQRLEAQPTQDPTVLPDAVSPRA